MPANRKSSRKKTKWDKNVHHRIRFNRESDFHAHIMCYEDASGLNALIKSLLRAHFSQAPSIASFMAIATPLQKTAAPVVEVDQIDPLKEVKKLEIASELTLPKVEAQSELGVDAEDLFDNQPPASNVSDEASKAVKAFWLKDIDSY